MQDRAQREALWLFRERVYHEGFERRRDALGDLLDALLVTGGVPSFVHLSLAQLFRRGWGCAYDALADGALDASVVYDDEPDGDGEDGGYRVVRPDQSTSRVHVRYEPVPGAVLELHSHNSMPA